VIVLGGNQCLFTTGILGDSLVLWRLSPDVSVEKWAIVEYFALTNLCVQQKDIAAEASIHVLQGIDSTITKQLLRDKV
jgi:hypothetical protein